MSLWGNSSNNPPKYVSPEQANNVVLVDDKSAMTYENTKANLKDAGWVLNNTYVAADGTVRRKSETLVALSNAILADYEPLRGYFGASTVNLLGASFIDNVPDSVMVDHLAAVGFTGTVKVYATASTTSADWTNQLAAARAENAGTKGNNLYIIDFGGNDVSQNRPYPGGAANLASNITALLNEIENDGDKYIFMPISFRYYSGVVDAGWNILDESLGSMPYNENVMYPLIKERKDKFWNIDANKPYIDTYNWSKSQKHLVNTSDGIHPSPVRTYTDFIFSAIARRVLGLPPTNQSGKSMLIPIGPVTRSYSDTAVTAGIAATDTRTGFAGFRWLNGEPDDTIAVEFVKNGTFSAATLAPPAGIETRMTDARFNHPLVVNRYMYATVGNALPSIKISGLQPGKQLTMSIIGVSGSAADRTGNYTLTGTGVNVSVSMNASINAAKNDAAFAPVTIPADGILTLNGQAPGGGVGTTLSGIILDIV